MAITAALIGGGLAAAGTMGNGLIGASANNSAAQRSFQIQQEQLDQARQNATAQQMVEALVNQRAIAGTQDSLGTSTVYDPVTNTWKTQLGALPQAASTAALRASIQQNTVDRAREELLNQIAMRRATQAGPAADAAARDVATYRPMQGDELTGLLTDQGITAARQAYDPLRADILRSTARTGTAAAPVLAELGRSEAQNLRNTLIDAQIQGMTGVGNINQQRFGNLAARAGTTAQLATPNLTTPPIAPDSTSALLGQLTSQRAAGAGGQTAAGMQGANFAQLGSNQAAGAVRPTNTDYTAQSVGTGLGQIGSMFAPGGAGARFLAQAFPGDTGQNTPDNAINSTPMNAAEMAYAYGGTPQQYTSIDPSSGAFK